MKLFTFKNFKGNVIKKGFTLIETLVAITVLMLAVTGPLVISQKGLSAAGYAKDQMIAYYLAQDAMEYVRNVRDTNIVRGVTGIGDDWLSVAQGTGVLSPCNLSSATCIIDTKSTVGTVTQCNSPCSVRLTKNTISSEYGYGTGLNDIPTPFVRSIKIERPDGTSGLDVNDKEARIKVVVSWPTPSGQTKDVTLVENLFKQN